MNSMYGQIPSSLVRPEMVTTASIPVESYRLGRDAVCKEAKDESFLYVEAAGSCRRQPIPSQTSVHWPDNLAVQNSATRKKFYCPRCNSGYTRLSDMKTHCQFQCGKEPRYQCPYCTKRAKFSSNMYVHVRRMHKDEKLQIIDLYKQLSRIRY